MKRKGESDVGLDKERRYACCWRSAVCLFKSSIKRDKKKGTAFLFSSSKVSLIGVSEH